MNTLESVLFYGGIGAVALGLIIIIIIVIGDISNEKLSNLCIFLISFGLIAFLVGLSIYNTNTLEKEPTEIVITIEDKKKTTYRIGKYGTGHDYLFYFNNGEKIEVDCSTYNKYQINDELIIKKIYWYRVDRETGERTLEDVTYSE